MTFCSLFRFDDFQPFQKRKITIFAFDDSPFGRLPITVPYSLTAPVSTSRPLYKSLVAWRTNA